MTALDTAEEYGLIWCRAALVVYGYGLMWLVIMMVSDSEAGDE